jgi:hypothetical protein
MSDKHHHHDHELNGTVKGRYSCLVVVEDWTVPRFTGGAKIFSHFILCDGLKLKDVITRNGFGSGGPELR